MRRRRVRVRVVLDKRERLNNIYVPVFLFLHSFHFHSFLSSCSLHEILYSSYSFHYHSFHLNLFEYMRYFDFAWASINKWCNINAHTYTYIYLVSIVNVAHFTGLCLNWERVIVLVYMYILSVFCRSFFIHLGHHNREKIRSHTFCDKTGDKKCFILMNKRGKRKRTTRKEIYFLSSLLSTQFSFRVWLAYSFCMGNSFSLCLIVFGMGNSQKIVCGPCYGM